MLGHRAGRNGQRRGKLPGRGWLSRSARADLINRLEVVFDGKAGQCVRSWSDDLGPACAAWRREPINRILDHSHGGGQTIERGGSDTVKKWSQHRVPLALPLPGDTVIVRHALAEPLAHTLKRYHYPPGPTLPRPIVAWRPNSDHRGRTYAEHPLDSVRAAVNLNDRAYTLSQQIIADAERLRVRVAAIGGAR